jgi:general stress protein 26
VAENKEMSEAEGRKKVFELIKEIRVSMMATFSPDGFIHARPMVARQQEGSGDLWFYTSRSSHTVEEIRADPRVLLTYAEPDDQNYVSITGRGTVVDDRAKARELWSEHMRTWFPKGVDDPDLILIRVDPERAQYWDAPSSAIVYAYGYVKAALTGQRPDPAEEGKVRL